MLNKSKIMKEFQNVLEEQNINEYIDNYFSKKRDYSDNKEYQELKKEYDYLYNQLQMKLTKSDKAKLDMLKGIIHEIEGLDNRIAYKIGLLEGIAIRNEVNNN